MRENFDKALALVLKSEGGFQADERDPGNKLPDGRPGATNLGVTQRAWEQFVGRQVTREEMKALTPANVSGFYKTQYWDKVKGDLLPSGTDYAVFDFAVNAGVYRASTTLQAACGAAQDGAIGPKTIEAAKNTPNLMEKFSLAKESFYRSLATFTIYGKGWLNRIAEVEKNAGTF